MNPLGFFKIYYVAKLQNIEGGPFGEKLRGGPFSLARYCMLRGKKEKPFWFSSLGQRVQFKIS